MSIHLACSLPVFMLNDLALPVAVHDALHVCFRPNLEILCG
jgi:hypothetical protein